jgi:hypothetical protein
MMVMAMMEVKLHGDRIRGLPQLVNGLGRHGEAIF